MKKLTKGYLCKHNNCKRIAIVYPTVIGLCEHILEYHGEKYLAAKFNLETGEILNVSEKRKTANELLAVEKPVLSDDEIRYIARDMMTKSSSHKKRTIQKITRTVSNVKKPHC